MPPPVCSFALNGKPASALVCEGTNYAAFSGTQDDTDNPADVADADKGPLPPGTYYIISRESGGHLGWLYDAVHSYKNGYDVTNWFMLWRDNGGGKVGGHHPR